MAGGFVVGINLTSGGSGYTTPPTVTILARGGAGNNATATATVNAGSVTKFTITNPGTGYANGAAVLIDPPPAAVLSPNSVSQVLRFDLGDLSPYDNYQLQTIPRADGVWGNLGGVFIPTAAINTQYITVTDSAGFFRVVRLP